jgi:hypothetical protein
MYVCRTKAKTVAKLQTHPLVRCSKMREAVNVMALHQNIVINPRLEDRLTVSRNMLSTCSGKLAGVGSSNCRMQHCCVKQSLRLGFLWVEFIFCL